MGAERPYRPDVRRRPPSWSLPPCPGPPAATFLQAPGLHAQHVIALFPPPCQSPAPLLIHVSLFSPFLSPPPPSFLPRPFPGEPPHPEPRCIHVCHASPARDFCTLAIRVCVSACWHSRVACIAAAHRCEVRPCVPVPFPLDKLPGVKQRGIHSGEEERALQCTSCPGGKIKIANETQHVVRKERERCGRKV